MRKTSRVATDVGGTFTDLVYFETDSETGAQTVRVAKTDTTPGSFQNGVLNVLDKAQVEISGLAYFAHGTTVVINALTERKGVATGLITTEGFRDVLEIARGNRPDFFNIRYRKPAPFVPRHLRREVPGRIGADGQELRPLELSGLARILDDFRCENVAAIAVCLLHAYANPRHEEELVSTIRRLAPEMQVVGSHQITREWREYERTNTTVLSAYVQPIAERYLTDLEHGIKARGYGNEIHVMQSNCGVDSLDTAKATPITMVESGPASGFHAAAELGRILGYPNIIALDIGGTTAKCSLIESGQVRISTDYWIERDHHTAGYPISVPVVDLVEIGNGGGSIASVDAFGKLKVGPHSAAAVPGPASYGRGGKDATTTDANLALGRINPDYFCGGEVKADTEAMWAAFSRLSTALGCAPVEAARGVIRIANSNMVNALKLVSVNRGFDPRDFTLLAFGGGGPMHAAALGAELGVKSVIIPKGAPVFSAWGMMMSDIRRDYFLSRIIACDQPEASAEALTQLLEEAEARAIAQFAEEDIARDRITLLHRIKCRYRNQEHSLEVALPRGKASAASVTALIDDFGAAYEREYSYRLASPIEFIGLHLTATADIGKLGIAPAIKTGRTVEHAIKGSRQVDYDVDGIHSAQIYDAGLLEPDMRFTGPAIVEDPGTTVVIHPQNKVSIDAFGNIIIELR